jgi:hypothetical protein
MKSLDINFCSKCTDLIFNNRLLAYWNRICVIYVTGTQHFISNDDLNSVKFLDALEKKGFIVTHETDIHILSKPLGVYLYKEDFLICLSPKCHFKELMKNIKSM